MLLALIRSWMPAPVRRWLYRVSIATIPLGIALGWWDAKTAALLVPILVALLNVHEDQ